MTKYEELVAEYDQEVNIEERNMLNNGLYCDNIIWIKGTLTTAEKTSIVAEEIGHYKTTAGDILDQNKNCWLENGHMKKSSPFLILTRHYRGLRFSKTL